MKNTMAHCPQCKNHCPSDELRCRHGREYFAQQKTSGERAQAADSQASQTKTTPDEQLLDLFRQCSHYLRHTYGHAAGLGRVMRFLHRHGSMSQRQLQELAQVKSASLSELLQKGEANGLLSRKEDESDKRTLQVELTKNGVRELQEQLSDEESDQNGPFAGLSQNETAQLEKLLGKLLLSWGLGAEDVATPCGHHGMGRRGRGMHGQRFFHFPSRH